MTGAQDESERRLVNPCPPRERTRRITAIPPQGESDEMKPTDDSTNVPHEGRDCETPPPRADGMRFRAPDPVSAHREENPPPFVTMGQLLDEPEESERWLVEGIVPCGALTLVIGAPKAGKSTATRCLGVAVATGAPWLGRNTTRGSVLYLCLEDKRAEVRRHFAAMGAPKDDSIRCFIDRLPPLGAAEQLGAWVDALKPRLVVIDPLFRFLRVEDVSDYARVSRAFDPLIDLARNSGVALVLTHHQRKSGGTDGNETLGSQAIFGSVDNTLFLYRDGDKRSMRTQVRIGEDIARTAIRLDGNGWVSLADAPEREKSIDAEVLDVLGDSTPAPLRRQDVHDIVGRRAEDVDAALERLVREGLVQRTGRGQKGHPYRFGVREREACARSPGVEEASAPSVIV